MSTIKNINDLIIYLQQIQDQWGFKDIDFTLSGCHIVDFEDVIKADNVKGIVDIGLPENKIYVDGGGLDSKPILLTFGASNFSMLSELMKQQPISLEIVGPTEWDMSKADYMLDEEDNFTDKKVKTWKKERFYQR